MIYMNDILTYGNVYLLANLLAGGLPAGALAASIASHTRGTTPTHTSNTKHTHASNTTQQKQKLELTMGGCAPHRRFGFFLLCCV